MRFEPEEYIRYFEDLKLAPNAEIGFMDSLRTCFYNLLQLVTSLQSIPPQIDLCSSYNLRIGFPGPVKKTISLRRKET